MVKNMSLIERCARVVVGLGVLSLLFWGPKKLWALVGLVPVLTGLSGWCPLYSLLGISTYHPKELTELKEDQPAESLG